MLAHVYPTAAFLIASRSLQRAREFCTQHAAHSGRLSGSDDAAAAAAAASIVVLCTSSSVPLFTCAQLQVCVTCDV